MSNHQKRLSAPDSWPVERKTETFTVKAEAGPHGEAGVPLLIILRDVLGYADSRKEARYALDQDSVLINGKAVSDEERPVGMFDILAFAEREENYRVFPGQGGRLSLTPIDADAAGSKLGKVVGKQHVPGGDLQLTLHDGQTLVVDEDAPYDGGDSLVVSNDVGDVVAHFEYEEGALVTAVDGEHAGEVGTVDEIQVTPGSADNIVRVEQADGGFETTENYVVVIDENFTSDDGTASETATGDTASTEAEPDVADEAEPDEAEPDEGDEADTDEAEADEAEGDETDADDAEAEESDVEEEAAEPTEEISEDVADDSDDGDANADDEAADSDDEAADSDDEPAGSDDEPAGSDEEAADSDDGDANADDEAADSDDEAADSDDEGGDEE